MADLEEERVVTQDLLHELRKRNTYNEVNM